MSAAWKLNRHPELVWLELLGSIDCAANDMERLGETEQAEALRSDARFLRQRAQRHLRRLQAAND